MNCKCTRQWTHRGGTVEGGTKAMVNKDEKRPSKTEHHEDACLDLSTSLINKHTDRCSVSQSLDTGYMFMSKRAHARRARRLVYPVYKVRGLMWTSSDYLEVLYSVFEFCMSPLQLFPSSCRMYPRGQEQR